jgi:hypothetical protein
MLEKRSVRAARLRAPRHAKTRAMRATVETLPEP